MSDDSIDDVVDVVNRCDGIVDTMSKGRSKEGSLGASIRTT